MKQAPPINPAMAGWLACSINTGGWQWIVCWLMVVVVDAYSHSSIRYKPGLDSDNGSVRWFADMVRGDASLFGANRTTAQLVRREPSPRFSELSEPVRLVTMTPSILCQ